MSFQTGTSSSTGDLLVKLFNFLQANGWTADVDYTSASMSPSFGVIKRQLSPLSDLNLYAGFAGLASDINIIPLRDYSSGDPSNAVEVATAGAMSSQVPSMFGLISPQLLSRIIGSLKVTTIVTS